MLKNKSSLDKLLLTVVFWLMLAQASHQAPSNCDKTSYSDLYCQVCSTGYFVKNYECQPCPPNCASCSSSSTCSQCMTGSTLNLATSVCSPSSSRRALGYILAFGAIALLYILAILCLKFNKSTHYTSVSGNPVVVQQQQMPGANMYQFQAQPQQAAQLPPGFS